MISEKNFLEKVKQGIEEFNKYKSPEAKASLIEIKDKKLKVKVSGPFCRACGFYDYFDDLEIEIESKINAELKIKDMKEEDEESYIVEFVLKEGGEK